MKSFATVYLSGRLSRLAHFRVKKSLDEIAAALHGNWREDFWGVMPLIEKKFWSATKRAMP